MSTASFIRQQNTARIESEIRNRLGSRIANLEVVSSSRGVVLRGEARSYYEKQLVQEAVLAAMPEVPIASNEIKVT